MRIASSFQCGAALRLSLRWKCKVAAIMPPHPATEGNLGNGIRMTSPHSSLVVVPGMRLNDIIVKAGARKNLTEIVKLADSINKHGLRQPLVLDGHNVLVFGHRRLAALRLLEWESAPVLHVKDCAGALEIARVQLADTDLQIPLKPSEMAEQVDLVARLGGTIPLQAMMGSRTTRDVVARAFGYGHTKLSQLSRVANAARAGDEDAVRALKKMDATGAIYGPYFKFRGLKDRQRRAAADAAIAEMENNGGITYIEEEPNRMGFRRRDHAKLLQTAVSTINATAQVVKGLDALDGTVSKEQAAGWASDLNRSLTEIRNLRKLLREHARANDTATNEPDAGSVHP